MGKYEPLEKFLRGRRAGRWRAGFRDIEALLGFRGRAEMIHRDDLVILRAPAAAAGAERAEVAR